MVMNMPGFGVGSIIIGLLLLVVVVALIYMFGVWAVAQMRRGRVNEETDISYPAVPQGVDDRRAVEQVQAREESATLRADNATDAELDAQAMGQSMQPVRQSPPTATSEVKGDRSPL